jgi:acetyl-CoA carboxylase, biotin carboxylase subunit
VEEAPSPAIDDDTRAALAEAAVRAVAAAGYENLGTLEFLVDREGRAFFIELNARIQVEHPVTEMLSGIDLVAEQIRIAAGEPLGYTQADVRLRGHAIEFRINAEDVAHDFRPQAGPVEVFLPPGGPGVRMDTHLFSGYEVPPYYDSLLGKVIVWGPDRQSAIARARGALGELVVEGLTTNLPFHRALLSDPTFLEGAFTTGLLDRRGAAAFLAAAAEA